MNTYYLCWIDDQLGFVDSLMDRINVLEVKKKIKIEIDEHNSTNNFDTIARNIDDDLIFLIDYNLKDSEGNGINGNQVIELIRENNKTCKIIFYSSIRTQNELREMIVGQPNIKCVQREGIIDLLNSILE